MSEKWNSIPNWNIRNMPTLPTDPNTSISNSPYHAEITLTLDPALSSDSYIITSTTNSIPSTDSNIYHTNQHFDKTTSIFDTMKPLDANLCPIDLGDDSIALFDQIFSIGTNINTTNDSKVINATPDSTTPTESESNYTNQYNLTAADIFDSILQTEQEINASNKVIPEIRTKICFHNKTASTYQTPQFKTSGTIYSQNQNITPSIFISKKQSECDVQKVNGHTKTQLILNPIQQFQRDISKMNYNNTSQPVQPNKQEVRITSHYPIAISSPYHPNGHHYPSTVSSTCDLQGLTKHSMIGSNKREGTNTSSTACIKNQNRQNLKSTPTNIRTMPRINPWYRFHTKLKTHPNAYDTNLNRTTMETMYNLITSTPPNVYNEKNQQYMPTEFGQISRTNPKLYHANQFCFNKSSMQMPSQISNKYETYPRYAKHPFHFDPLSKAYHSDKSNLCWNKIVSMYDPTQSGSNVFDVNQYQKKTPKTNFNSCDVNPNFGNAMSMDDSLRTNTSNIYNTDQYSISIQHKIPKTNFQECNLSQSYKKPDLTCKPMPIINQKINTNIQDANQCSMKTDQLQSTANSNHEKNQCKNEISSATDQILQINVDTSSKHPASPVSLSILDWFLPEDLGICITNSHNINTISTYEPNPENQLEIHSSDNLNSTTATNKLALESPTSTTNQYQMKNTLGKKYLVEFNGSNAKDEPLQRTDVDEVSTTSKDYSKSSLSTFNSSATNNSQIKSISVTNNSQIRSTKSIFHLESSVMKMKQCKETETKIKPKMLTNLRTCTTNEHRTSCKAVVEQKQSKKSSSKIKKFCTKIGTLKPTCTSRRKKYKPNEQRTKTISQITSKSDNNNKNSYLKSDILPNFCNKIEGLTNASSSNVNKIEIKQSYLKTKSIFDPDVLIESDSEFSSDSGVFIGNSSSTKSTSELNQARSSKIVECTADKPCTNVPLIFDPGLTRMEDRDTYANNDCRGRASAQEISPNGSKHSKTSVLIFDQPEQNQSDLCENDTADGIENKNLNTVSTTYPRNLTYDSNIKVLSQGLNEHKTRSTPKLPVDPNLSAESGSRLPNDLIFDKILEELVGETRLAMSKPNLRKFCRKPPQPSLKPPHFHGSNKYTTRFGRKIQHPEFFQQPFHNFNYSFRRKKF